MNTATATRAEEIATRLFEQQRQYEVDQREAAEDGFRPHYCIHGTNLWTDYDNICGGCEDGTFTQYSTPAEVRAYAHDLAKGEEARKARQTVEVTNTIERVVRIYRNTGKLVGEPRIYRNGPAATVLMDTTEGKTVVAEIDDSSQPTFLIAN